VTGIGFLSKGRLAVCTIYGDVWIASGLDTVNPLRWKRFAAGLYQPMGLVIRDGDIHVLERGQITRLRDLNGDDEADAYDNVYNGWDSPGSGHAYDTGLKLAPDGSFFFFKGQAGGKLCRESGCLVRVLPGARRHEVFASGFRHPIGLGMSPDGVVTGADQQGNWMPATRIDQYRKGGFYGDMRTHQRKIPPKTYDPPVCWLPRYVDNSAGGQIWVPRVPRGDSAVQTWGSLSGQSLHLSWGRCRLFLLMRQQVGDLVQGGVVRLPCPEFAAGPITGAFRPDDGHLYVVGLHGWQTAGEADGCLQRVRHSGGKLYQPVNMRVAGKRIELQFDVALDPDSIRPANVVIERWNYRYSGSYGSDHWSVANPKRMGHDLVPVAKTIVSNEKTLVLVVPTLKPVMQMKIQLRLRSRDGKPIHSTIHSTIHRTKNSRTGK